VSHGTSGGEISAVSGVAQAAGLQAGDRLLAANGHPLRDVLDWSFYADGPTATVRVHRGEGEWTVRLRRPAGSDWGIAFSEPLFDGLRRCANRCLFCFMDQLPSGWRRTLYLRDDDYRLSFLYGNFVTLTNLRPEDWDRLAEQRLSPLYVSVHATEPDLRRRLLGRKRAPDVLEQIERLGRLHIAVHAQVVLCPGINDGPHLERTLADLRRLYPTVQSVSLVPVGLTRFRTPPPADLEGVEPALRPYTPDEARDLLAWALPHQRALRRTLDCGFLYPADEFYLLAERAVPSARLYDGFPQLENGVGLVRLLLDDWARTRRRLPPMNGEDRGRPERVRARATLATGTLLFPVLLKVARELAARMPGADIEVLPIENVTFGPTVTVAGLLTGEALRSGLRAAQGDVLFLPIAAFDDQGRALDDVTVGALEQELGRPIVLVDRMSQVVRALRTHDD
jgi:putative radical SAM enzyme (TIGR03279 family)